MEKTLNPEIKNKFLTYGHIGAAIPLFVLLLIVEAGTDVFSHYLWALLTPLGINQLYHSYLIVRIVKAILMYLIFKATFSRNEVRIVTHKKPYLVRGLFFHALCPPVIYLMYTLLSDFFNILRHPEVFDKVTSTDPITFERYLNDPINLIGVFIVELLIMTYLEEYIYRGLMNKLNRKFSVYFCIIISALFFGLVEGPRYFPRMFITGLVTSYLYYVTGSIRITMAASFLRRFSCFMILAINQLPFLNRIFRFDMVHNNNMCMFYLNLTFYLITIFPAIGLGFVLNALVRHPVSKFAMEHMPVFRYYQMSLYGRNERSTVMDYEDKAINQLIKYRPVENRVLFG